MYMLYRVVYVLVWDGRAQGLWYVQLWEGTGMGDPGEWDGTCVVWSRSDVSVFKKESEWLCLASPRISPSALPSSPPVPQPPSPLSWTLPTTPSSLPNPSASCPRCPSQSAPRRSRVLPHQRASSAQSVSLPPPAPPVAPALECASPRPSTSTPPTTTTAQSARRPLRRSGWSHARQSALKG